MTCLALVVQSGCASVVPPPAPELRRELGRVVVAADPTPPRQEFLTFAKGRVEGAAKGGGAGAASGLLYMLAEGGSPAAGPYAGGAALIVAALAALVGLVTGSVAGAHEAVPAGTAAEIETALAAALAGLRLSEDLAAATARAGEGRGEPAVRGLVQPGDTDFDSLLTVGVTAAGLQGGSGKDPETRLYLVARIELSDAQGGAPRYARDFRYTSRPQRFETWFADQGALLAAELQEGIADLSVRVLDELLLVAKFPFPGSGLWAPPGSPAFSTCWLYPIDPERRLRSFWSSMRQGPEDMYETLILDVPVSSLHPRLRWEPFPRGRDQTEANLAMLARIDDVRYDLKVWEAPDRYPERLVIDQTGLPAPEFTPEYPLSPAKRHFWTFRARYRLDGELQVTRWAFSVAPNVLTCELDDIPPTNYYRFVTPASPAAPPDDKTGR